MIAVVLACLGRISLACSLESFTSGVGLISSVVLVYHHLISLIIRAQVSLFQVHRI